MSNQTTFNKTFVSNAMRFNVVVTLDVANPVDNFICISNRESGCEIPYVVSEEKIREDELFERLNSMIDDAKAFAKYYQSKEHVVCRITNLLENL